MREHRYTIRTRVDGDPDDVEDRVRAALSDQGFGILSEIDVRAALREKLGEDVGHYTILGACNPPLARTAIDIDDDIGALLPCNVVVRGRDDGAVDVLAADPIAMLGVADDVDLSDVAGEARTRLEAALESL